MRSRPTGTTAPRRPTVAAGYARGLLELAVSRGGARAELLEATGLSATDLEDQDRRIPLDAYLALMRVAQRLTDDPALALHYGEAVPLADVSVVGLFGQASETALDAFRQLNRYARLVIDPGGEDTGDRFRLIPQSSGLWLVDSWALPRQFPELGETAFSSILRWAREYGDGGVREVHFQHAAPTYADEYDRIFRVPVTFGRAQNAMRIDPAAVTAKVARLPPYTAELFAARADGLLSDLQQAATVRGDVEAQMISMLPDGRADLSSVAVRLGMSRATLARRLSAEGVTFKHVLEDLRRRLAVQHLATATVKETAYRLGFSDPAAFSRAFKRWTGRTAHEVRGRRKPR